MRESFQRAFNLRLDLTDRDRAVLNALEPISRDPPDYKESYARTKRARDAFPLDAELWHQAGLRAPHSPPSEGAEGLAADRRATELDPTYADAWDRVAIGILRTSGDWTEARAALDRCLTISPRATLCLHDRAKVADQLGDCQAMANDAKQGAEMANLRASALFALRAPREAIEEALKAPQADFNEDTPEGLRIKLDVASGFIASAATRAQKMVDDVADQAEGIVHAEPATLLAESLVEMGRPADANRVARDYLHRKDAWVFPPYWASAELLGVLRAGGASHKGQWDTEVAGLPKSRMAPEAKAQPWAIWAALYGPAVQTEEEAKAALGELADYGPGYEQVSFFVDPIGAHVLLLAGKADEAIAILTQESKRCRALEYPFAHTRAHLWLGQALETKGDKAGACAAYGVVLARWGNAQPRSVTAEKARERVKALGCTP